jgi:photosystem II stability/assembly factor-like uncharacterized protein
MFALAGLMDSLVVQELIHAAALSNAKPPRDPLSGLSASTISSIDNRLSPDASRMRAGEFLGKLPLSFEPNRGQADRRVKFISRASDYTVFLTPTDATLTFKDMTRSNLRLQDEVAGRQSQVRDVQAAALRMSLVGAMSSARIVGLDELPGKSNYFIGDDPTRWRVNVPAYSKVKYEQVYPGIDLIYYGNQRQLEYDFSVAPGANPRAIRISFEGPMEIRVDAGGDLAIKTPAGEVRQHKPEVYQVRNGIKRQISARYGVKGERVVGFELGEYDSRLPLTIDPVLVYSTYLGGSDADQANAVAVDSDGNAYVTGFTLSSNFPAVRALQPNRGSLNNDVFVTKFNPSGNALIYSTYLGGDGSDEGNSIAVDSSGSVYVTGKTSGKFPTTANAFQTDPAGGYYDAFVTKLSPAGDALAYSTYLGGGPSPPPTFFNPNSGTDIGYGIAVDPLGNAYVTGVTYSPTFPTKKAIQSVINRGNRTVSPSSGGPAPPPPLYSDAFVTKLNSSGTGLVYSTYLGDILDDEGRGIAVDASGSACVAGATSGAAFLVKLEPSGRAFVFSTLLGGSADDKAYGVALDSAGNAYVTGETTSVDFPTTSNAFQTSIGGSPIFKSIDGGKTWSSSSAGLPDNSFNALVIDPVTPTTLYAVLGETGKPIGAFKSTDGGGHWFAINSGFSNSPTPLVRLLTIDPKTPSTLYAISFNTIFKSTDSGNSWNFISHSMIGFSPESLSVDPVTPSTLYSGANLCPPPPIPARTNEAFFEALSSERGTASLVQAEDFFEHGLFKTTDGGMTWSATALPSCAAGAVAIDPKTSSTIYTSTLGSIFKSTDGGNTWSKTSNPAGVLAIDPVNPSTIYAAPSFGLKINKSTNGGTTWSDTGLTGVNIQALAIDPINPATIYAGANNLTRSRNFFDSGETISGFGGGVFKSTDGGDTWSAPTLIGAAIQALVIDPLNPSTLYAGAFRDSDAFVTKFNAAGALVFSTLVGGVGRDAGLAVAVDSAGRAYITGKTFSGNFPTRDAIQSNKASGIFATGGFVAMLDAAGAALAYSTHLGGSGVANDGDAGMGIAVDAFGKAYVAGRTASGNFPTRTPIQPGYGGNLDAFLSRIAFPPRIATVSISGKNLSVTGENFDRGAGILIDGEEQRTRNDESRPATTLIGKKTAKSIAPGQRVAIQVRNSDGLLSESFSFVRPVQ